MSTPSDEYFVRMMESTWLVPEEENTAVTQQTVSHLLREVKARVFELARRDPAFLKKIFNDFDLNQSGHLTIDEVTNLIAKLKISVERKFVYPFFKVADPPAPPQQHVHEHLHHAGNRSDPGLLQFRPAQASPPLFSVFLSPLVRRSHEHPGPRGLVRSGHHYPGHRDYGRVAA